MLEKKYQITVETEVLLKLLRISIGTERDYSFPSDVNWRELIRLAATHKVSPLAFDGLTQSGYHLPDKALYNAWRNDVTKSEQSYTYYLQILTTLCQIFTANSLTPIILKGYGLSLNYSIPSHRGCGDIDIFLIDKDGNPATEQGVKLIENTLNIKTKKVPHDYEFYFKGIEVELHYDTTNAYWDTDEERYIVDKLTKLLLHDPIPCPNINGALLPPPTFNAAYLIRHTYGHFYTASGNIRQYIDWLLFLRKHNDNVNWDEVNEVYKRSGMTRFAESLNALLNKWFNTNLQTDGNNMVEQILTRDMTRAIPNGRHLHQRIRYYYSNREKLSFLTGKWWVVLLYCSIVTTMKHLIKPSKTLY